MGAEDGVVTEELSADSAFEVLGHETRLAIVEALGEADEDLSFSELREIVGERDSGQFNYHLDRLRETFVTQTEDGAYGLTFAGAQVFAAVLTGRYTKTGDIDEIPVKGECVFCSGALEGSYQGRTFEVQCQECGETLTQYPIPPGVIEAYDIEEFADVAARYLSTRQTMFRQGICPMCAGPIETAIKPVEEGYSEVIVSVGWSCKRCGVSMESSLPAALLEHPAIQLFGRKHGGIDKQIWEFDWLLDGEAEIVSEEPMRVETAVEADGERLELVVDGEGAVVDETWREL